MWMLARRAWRRLTLWLAVGVVVVGGSAVAWAASSSRPMGSAAQAPVAGAAQAGSDSDSDGPPTFVDEANRAQSAPISLVRYEVQVRHFPREDCQSDGDGIIMGDGASEEGNDLRSSSGTASPTARAAGFKKDEDCVNRFASARAFCPGGNLRVIGGGARLFTREEAVVIDSYPDDDGAWVIHIERIPVFERRRLTASAALVVDDDDEDSGRVLLETRIEITAICAEVASEHSKPD
jgi:hypothetical protein